MGWGEYFIFGVGWVWSKKKLFFGVRFCVCTCVAMVRYRSMSVDGIDIRGVGWVFLIIIFSEYNFFRDWFVIPKCIVIG